MSSNQIGLLSDFISPVNTELADNKERVPPILSAIRKHLDMDVAFVAEFHNGHRVFRHVDSKSQSPIQAGDSNPLEESYCQRVVDGRLPELIHDATQNPEALKLPVTTALPVGAHISVPIKLKDGSVYGTFCCFSYSPDTSLTERDLNIMRVFAELTAEQIDTELEESRVTKAIKTRIESVHVDGSLSMVYQPIFKLHPHEVVGFESLARFLVEPYRTPDVWFKEAAQVGLDIHLQFKAAEQALQSLEHLPDEVYISINLSPDAILNQGLLTSVLKEHPLERVVLEVTEHDVIQHYDEAVKAISILRNHGLRIAIDDAGAGYASFRHILNLSPDIIKLDLTLIRNIDSDVARYALAKALITFANEIGATVVAEGVETNAELETLRELGVNKAQGYLLGKPGSLSSAIDFLRG